LIEQQRMPSNCQGRGPTFGPRNCPRTRGYQCFDCEAESSAKALNLHVCAGTLRYTVGQHVRFDGTYCPRHEVEIGEIVGRVVGFEVRSKLEEDGHVGPFVVVVDFGVAPIGCGCRIGQLVCAQAELEEL